VGAVLVRDAGERREVLFHIRKAIIFEGEFRLEGVLPRAIRTLDEVLTDIKSHKLYSLPKKVHLTLGSPWYFCQTRSIIHNSDTPQEYNKSLVTKILLEEEESFVSEHFIQTPVVMIDRELFGVKLNGYSTNQPENKEAKLIELSVYLSMADAHVVDSFKSRLLRHFYKGMIELHTFSLLAIRWSNMRVGERVSSYILLDIGGEVSELTLIRNQIAVENHSFPLGAHSVQRLVATKLGTSVAEGVSIYEAYLRKRTDSKVSQKIATCESEVKTKWTTYLINTLEVVAQRYIEPQTIVIIASNNSASLIKSILEGSQLKQSLSIPGNRTIILADQGLTQDVFLSIEASAIEKITDSVKI